MFRGQSREEEEEKSFTRERCKNRFFSSVFSRDSAPSGCVGIAVGGSHIPNSGNVGGGLPDCCHTLILSFSVEFFPPITSRLLRHTPADDSWSVFVLMEYTRLI